MRISTQPRQTPAAPGAILGGVAKPGRLLVSLLAGLLLSTAVTAQQSRAVLPFSEHARPESRQYLKITGNNTSRQPQVLVIRLDDRPDPAYTDRINLEREVAPGRFEQRIALGGLRTPGGRAFDLSRLRHAIAFQGRGDGALQIDPIELLTPTPLPRGSIAWDLGDTHSALWPGFTAVTPAHPGVRGRQLSAIDRSARKQAADALSIDGIRGIETLHLPLPPGEWFITLWLGEPGEWEFLPHPLQRRIKANGQLVYQRRLSPMQWIRQVYLAGAGREAGKASSSWSLFGAPAAQSISFPVSVAADGLTLQLHGERPESGFLAALLAEPDPRYPARRQVQREREAWWKNTWAIEPWRYARADQGMLAALQRPVTAARTTHVNLRFDLYPGDTQQVPEVHISAPMLNAKSLPTQLRWGRWHLRRAGLASTLLRASNAHLRSGTLPPLAPGDPPRRLHLRVYVPADAAAGSYRGSISVRLGKQTLSAPLLVDVPELSLPETDRPIGLYLEQPVHFGWFEATRPLADHATRCDLEFLARQGLSGIAPPLDTPISAEQENRFVEQLRSTRDAGFQAPYLAYASFKRLRARLGLEATFKRIAQLEQRLQREGIEPPAWATADEPSNPGQPPALGKTRRYAQVYAPGVTLAGQLNHAADRRHLEAFDIVLLNAAFDIDPATLQAIRESGRQPWLYNMPNVRAAAGFYLWRVAAAGYLQWHARMPTADPFDPTDGREDDVQYLYPMADPCPAVPEVDEQLFALSDGITDLRWLLWLEAAASTDPRAQTLLQQIRERIPERGEAIGQLGNSEMDSLRQLIIRLATSA